MNEELAREQGKTCEVERSVAEGLFEGMCDLKQGSEFALGTWLGGGGGRQVQA